MPGRPHEAPDPAHPRAAPSTISFHLKKLADVGAVSSSKSQYYTMYTLNRELFDKTMLSILQQESDDAAVQDERERQWREKVLRSFFDEDGRLRTIPAQRKKRLIVLERLAEEFEPGRDYSEREVNLIIANYHDDFCTLRRDLVDEPRGRAVPAGCAVISNSAGEGAMVSRARVRRRPSPAPARYRVDAGISAGRGADQVTPNQLFRESGQGA